jgi:hypothetical protein
MDAFSKALDGLWLLGLWSDSRVCSTVCPATETADVRWQRFWCFEVRPAGQVEQFERKLQLVVERQTLDGVCDRRVQSNHALHVLQSTPGDRGDGIRKLLRALPTVPPARELGE